MIQKTNVHVETVKLFSRQVFTVFPKKHGKDVLQELYDAKRHDTFLCNDGKYLVRCLEAKAALRTGYSRVVWLDEEEQNAVKFLGVHVFNISLNSSTALERDMVGVGYLQSLDLEGIRYLKYVTQHGVYREGFPDNKTYREIQDQYNRVMMVAFPLKQTIRRGDAVWGRR
jgi:hypothetical protein